MKIDDDYRKLCKRYDETGHAHHLTFSCFQNRPFLSKDRTRIWLMEAISNARLKQFFDLWAWVIMQEHVHLLILPKNTSISKILFTIKDPVARKAARFVQQNAPQFIHQMADVQSDGKKVLRFWQRGGGYDRNIFSIEELHEKIQYIHKNPLRRELVESPEQWPWSS